MYDIAYIAGWMALIYYIGWKYHRAWYNILYPNFFPPRDLHKMSGARWAVITGSTDGIGKAYAFELARKGFDLVLISRSQQRLDDTAKEIRAKYLSCTIKTIAFDFTNTNVTDYETHIFSELSQIHVGILVNNVGAGPEYPEYLHELEGGLPLITDITIVNMVSTVLMSAFVLKQMSKRGNGIIVNMSSAAGYFPNTFFNVYSASKAYVIRLSELMRKEYEPLGVTVQVVCPMIVGTKMTKYHKETFFTPTPKTFAEQAVRSIGRTANTAGCLSHQFNCEFGLNMTFNCIIDFFLTTRALILRRRALKRAAIAANLNKFQAIV